jgi:D-3-phosphoglycerate dehydrogenase
MKKVLITSRVHESLPELLRRQGYEPVLLIAASEQDIKQSLNGAEGIIVTTRIQVDKSLIEAAPNLKWIGRLGSGMEHIDVTYAQSKGIRCISTPEGNRTTVAEHTLGMLLCLMNKIHASHRQVTEGKWVRYENRGTELSGKTVGIIGYGNTGSALAGLLRPFGVTVLAYDKYKSGFAADYIKEASLEQVCRYADVISFHIPLTDETKYMVNENFLDLLQNKPWLLNTSRGKILVLQDLKKALQKGQIAGAGLDVLENEKPETYTDEEKKLMNWFYHQPNVIITPHIAGYSEEAFRKMGEILMEKLENGVE